MKAAEVNWNQSNGSATLQKALMFDLRRRQEILHYEIHHLIQATVYRNPPDGPNKNTPTPVEVTGNVPPDHSVGSTSTASHLKRIIKAADELRSEILADISERKLFEEWRKEIVNADVFPKKLDAHQTNSAPPLDVAEYECFHQVWHSKMMLKASVIAERIGELHARLERQLERTNLDHPTPLLRRRAEQGQIDKFLCEHVKWVHRDIAQQAIDYKEDYPYTEVPSTFQSWHYVASSSQHSFVSYRHYLGWTARDKNVEPKVPDKFSSIGLSYWMPDRIVSHPIIGHELAHQVLQDLYGKGMPQADLEKANGQLSRTIRRLIHCVEAWLSHKEHNHGAARSWDLVREIVCDILAAQRYGYAYLYAWILEISEIDVFANLTQDSHGMLSRINDFKSTINSDYIKRELMSLSKILAASMRTDIYHRGKVLLEFLHAVGRESDLLSEGLHGAVDCWLERLLGLVQGIHSANTLEEATVLRQGYEFEREFAKDLALIVVEERDRMSPKWSTFGETRSQFLQTASKTWSTDSAGVPNKISFRKQVMTNAIRSEYIDRISKLIPNAFGSNLSRTHLRTFQDAVWRVEWAIAAQPDQQTPPKAIDFNQLRRLSSVAIDDYMYRTGNPYRLIYAIERSRGTSPESPSTYASGLNTILDHRLIEIYEPPWLKQLNEALRNPVKNESLQMPNGNYFTIEKEELEKLGPLFLSESELKEIKFIDSESALLELHLISMKPAAPVAGNPLEKIKLEYRSPPTFELVLGRYDAFSIGPYAPAHPATAMLHVEKENDPQKDPLPLCTVSRLKKLVPVGATSSGKDPLAITLISLQWDAARIMSAIWLYRTLRDSVTSKVKNNVDIYISDGWEDLVVVFKRSPQQSDEDSTGNSTGQGSTQSPTPSLDDDLSELTKLIKTLNELPLVSGTETLFSSKAIENNNLLRYRFVCSRGSHGISDLKSAITGKLKGNEKIQRNDWELENLAGVKDLQVILKNQHSAEEMYNTLHAAANGDDGFRIETRVSWTT